jgi:hypothetical protein
VDDYEIAEATWLAAVERWPRDIIILRQGARVVRDSQASQSGEITGLGSAWSKSFGPNWRTSCRRRSRTANGHAAAAKSPLRNGENSPTKTGASNSGNNGSCKDEKRSEAFDRISAVLSLINGCRREGRD